MRLFINAIHTQTGGGLVYLNSVLPELAKRPDLTLSVLMHKTAANKITVPDGVEVITADFTKSMVRTLVWEQLNVSPLARRWQADAVLCIANYVPLFAPNPVQIIINNAEAGLASKGLYQKVYWFLLKALTRLSAIACPITLTLSEAVAESYFKGFWRVIKPTVFWAPPGCPVVATGQTKREDGLIFAVGDYYPHKNYPLLLAAFALLRKTHPQARLVIVGRPLDAEATAQIETTLLTHNLKGAVELVGGKPHAEVMAYFSRCHMYAQPSLAETFGMTTVEAMAAGAPCVLADKPFQREVAGDDAVYVPNADSQAGAQQMAEAFAKLLDDPALCAQLSENGRKRAAQFTWAKTAARIASALQNIPIRSR